MVTCCQPREVKSHRLLCNGSMEVGLGQGGPGHGQISRYTELSTPHLGTRQSESYWVLHLFGKDGGKWESFVAGCTSHVDDRCRASHLWTCSAEAQEGAQFHTRGGASVVQELLARFSGSLCGEWTEEGRVLGEDHGALQRACHQW